MPKGDIILVTFPFTNLTGTKLRPGNYTYRNNLDVTVCFITTQTQWEEPTDLKLSPSNVNGLKKASLIRTGKIATLSKDLVKGRLGSLSSDDLLNFNIKLKQLLQLP